MFCWRKLYEMMVCNLRTVKRTEIELSVYSRCDTVGKTITPATTKQLMNQKLTYSFASILKLRAEFKRKFDIKPVVKNHCSITVNKNTKCTSNFWICTWYPKVTQTTSNLLGSIIAWYTWTAKTLYSHNQLQYSLCFMILILTKWN